MDAREAQEHQIDLPKMLAMFGRVAPKVIIQLIPLFFRFRTQAKKGAHVFHHQLVDAGLADDVADKLTAEYLSGSDIIQFFQLFGSSKK